MRFALESADVGIWDMDYATGVVRLVRDSRSASTACGPDVRRHLRGVHRAESIPTIGTSVLETVAEAMKSGADFSMLHRTVWPDGTVRWLSGAGRVHLGEHGEPVRGVGISMDVTERRIAGRAVSAGAEDGSRRPAGRRRGARLQQPADGDPRLLRAAAGGSRSGRSAPGRHRGDPEGGHAAPRG